MQLRDSRSRKSEWVTQLSQNKEPVTQKECTLKWFTFLNYFILILYHFLQLEQYLNQAKAHYDNRPIIINTWSFRRVIHIKNQI